jgi:TolB protein
MITRHTLLALALAGAAVALAPVEWSSLDAKAVTSAVLPQDQQPVYDIAISGNTGARRRLAIPEFTVGAGAAADVTAAAKTISEVLWDDIEYEGEFYVTARADAAKIPPADSIGTLPYDRWTEIGVDFVVLGNVSTDEKGLNVRVQIVGTRGELRGKQVFGRIYGGGGCNPKNPRFCAHYISDEFHKAQGIEGVARTRVAFASDRGSEVATGRLGANNAQEIYISDYDGANLHRITVSRNLSIAPTWSPDGRYLAYTSYATGFPDIYVQSVFEAGKLTRPAAGTPSIKNSLPAFSPDGTRVAFTSIRDGGEQEVFVANRDGSNVRQLTNHRLSSFAPSWSPGGNQIVFVSDRGGDAQLYVMGADGSGVEHLACGQSRCDHPSWSTMTNRIAYTCGNDAAGYDVCVIDMASRRISNLTEGQPGSYEQPTFAPNGRHILFNTTRWGKKQLATIDITGKMHDRRITNTGNNTYPAWSRSPQ